MWIGGTLATAGRLNFIADGDETFRAYGTRDGKARWSFQTGAGVNAPPITYAVNGKQYIAVASSGSWQLNFPRGDTLWVFALGGSFAPAKPQPIEPRMVLTSQLSITLTGFTPSRLVVQPGTAITWTNDTNAPQRVAAQLGEWRSEPIAPGKSFTHIFRLEGTFDFVAPLVPGLLGTIIVSDHAGKPGGR